MPEVHEWLWDGLGYSRAASSGWMPARKQELYMEPMNELALVPALRELAELHTIRYEAWPEYQFAEGKKTAIGFSLELYGTHDHGSSSLAPGCPKCVRTFEDMRRIAEWILPKEERASQYDILPFDHSMTLDPRRGSRAEVALKIKILHRQHYFAPVDECEEKCLTEMKQKLEELGVRRAR
ncbi:MAG: hypothetical protein R2729_03960 [Bryobacteraceae bacterium]